MFYTIVNGERRAIAPYFTKASIQDKIDGLNKAIEILSNDTTSPKTIRLKVIEDWEKQIVKLEIKLKKTRY